MLSSVTLESGAFHDAVGRELLFHGTNAIVKGAPWYPEWRSFSPDISMSEDDFVLMEELGMNVLRLGVMWPGVEPLQGQYNETYLDQIEEIVSLGSQHGVYTLLDMHQDGLSEFFCGEGLPNWAVRHTDYFKEDKHGYPFPFDSPMGEGDFFVEEGLPTKPTLPSRTACSTKKQGPGWHEPTMASANAYEAFYKNVDGMLDAWADMWAHVVERFEGNDSVLGVELINEPFAGDLYRNPLLMVPRPNPKNADKVNLQPAYQVASEKIREVDTERLIFFDAVTWSDLGSGFTEAPGGEEFANKTVLGFHYYAPPQLDPFKGHSTLQFKAQQRISKKLGAGTFLTETSQPDLTKDSDGFSVKGGIGDAADATLSSWAGYEWKSFCREGPESSESQMGEWGACKTGYSRNFNGDRPEDEFMVANGRTYARAVAGKKESMLFDVDTKDFILVYRVNGVSKTQETEIFAYYLNYPDGLSVDVQGAGAEGVWDEETGKVSVRVGEGAREGEKVTVRLSRK
ncbi:hypothetical protein TrCOL_g9172 [Triparma columacea]|uniref:Endoglycoceramidase n=1 Tax=Triparma columacea TaxID=722753 RepID=A0A9W7G405_9STRA|nr:hypothetical protein TrCOL_g9172 [Triparma columacea]